MKQETKIALSKDMIARDSVKNLQTNPDWKIIETFLIKKYNEAILRLKVAKDPLRDQAIIAVIDSLIEELGITIQLGNRAEDLFKQIKEKEKLNYV